MKFIPEPRRAPSVPLSTVGARRDFFCVICIHPPGSHRSGGRGAFLRYFDSSPVLGLLLFTFQNGVTYKPGTLCSLLHCTRLGLTVLFSSGVGPGVPISD